jgi:competence CoiA-like predicted nuclease
MVMSQVMSRCPVCQARVYVNAGNPTPPHQAEGSEQQCPGTGQPSK